MALFTPETAREAGRKGQKAKVIADARRKQEGDARLAAFLKAAENPPTTDEPTKARLTRVRYHLERIAEMLDRETDASAVNQLAKAWATLDERERILAGRPNPGSLRPKPQRPRAQPVEPLGLEQPTPAAGT